MIIKGLAFLLDMLTILLIFGGPIFGIYYLIKRLIRYNAACQDQYARHRKAEQDLEDIEDDLNRMKDHDWSKEAPER